MTRQEFIDTVDNWGDLLRFCSDESLDACSDICSEDEYDSDILDEIYNRIDSDSWKEIRNYLDDLPSGYDFYRKDDWGDWFGVDDDDFQDYKNEVLEEMDDYDGAWDEEEPEEIDDNDDDAESEIAEEEDIPIKDLFYICSNDLKDMPVVVVESPEEEAEDNSASAEIEEPEVICQESDEEFANFIGMQAS